MLLSYCCIALFLGSVLATSCPTWFYYDNTTQQCQCGVWLSCSSNKTVEIQDGFCATSAGEGDQYYIGGCPLRHTVNNTNRIYSEMPADPDLLDDVMCGPYNRKGLLCGRCIDGYGPTAHILDLRCANCSKLPEYYAIPLYLVIELLPITLLFICITLFNFNITSGPLLGYIVFCQGYLWWMKKYVYIYEYIKSQASPSFQVLFNISLAFCSFLSLQYVTPVAPPFCISEKLSDIDIQMLSLVPAAYPILLITGTFILFELHTRNVRVIKTLWKPFSIILKKTNIKAVNGDAVIHAFASFIFLSSLSIYATIGNVGTDTHIRRKDSSIYKHVVYFDPSLKYFGYKHMLYITIGIIPAIFLTVIPSVFHIIYPTRIYGYLSRCLSGRKRLAITAFAEALQVCFKDGLNGTRDYRSLAGIITLVPFVFILSQQILTGVVGFRPETSNSINFIITCCIITYIQPCKSAIANISLSFNLLLLGGIFAMKHWWFYSMSPVPTNTQMLIFIFIPSVFHLLVCVWAGYALICCIKKHHRFHFTSCDCTVALTNTLCIFCRRRRDYEELNRYSNMCA